MDKSTFKSSKPQYLPSLLDRVTDNQYIDNTVELSQQRINVLEKKLSSKDEDITTQRSESVV